MIPGSNTSALFHLKAKASFRAAFEQIGRLAGERPSPIGERGLGALLDAGFGRRCKTVDEFQVSSSMSAKRALPARAADPTEAEPAARRLESPPRLHVNPREPHRCAGFMHFQELIVCILLTLQVI